MWDLIKAWAGRARQYPIPTQTVDVSAAVTAAAGTTTHADFSDNPLKRIYVGGAGDVYVRRYEDPSGTFFKYVMPAGGYVTGVIVEVGATSPAATTATELRGER